MNKAILTTILVLVAVQSYAKGGGQDPAKLEFKNSQAGFVAESLEHSMRLFVNVNGGDKDQVKDANVISTDLNNTVVNIVMFNGMSAIYNCSRVDHYSNGGTVLKKEVICQIQ